MSNSKYNIEKFEPGKTKFNCPAKTEGGEAVVRVFIGVDQATKKLKFQTFNGVRGVGRPLAIAEIPSDWRKAA